MEICQGWQARARRHSRYAKATFRKDLRLNIRLSSKDLEAIQKRALAEGLPYQTLISRAALVALCPFEQQSGDLRGVSNPSILGLFNSWSPVPAS